MKKYLLGSTESEINAQERFSELPDSLVDKPWKSIKSFYERRYTNTGGFVFSYASLLVASISSPKILITGDRERANFSILLLGNSGSGKSSLMGEVEDLAPRNYYVSSDTAANSERELANKGKDGVCLVVNDLKRIIGDSDQIKAYESMIGDGRISKKDAGHKDDVSEKDLQIAMIGGAVPSDVTKQIGSGLLFRVVPIMLKYEQETNGDGEIVQDEEAEVGKQIIDGVGSNVDTEFRKEHIKQYYSILDKIAKGRAEDIPEPVGYVFEDEFKEIIFDRWNYLRQEEGWQKDNLQWFRELKDGIRFACLRAFLNINNRPRVNLEGEEDKCKIKVSREDAEQAADLMTWEMAFKWKYVQVHLKSQLGELDEVDPDDVL